MIDTYGGGRRGNVSYQTDRGMVRTGPTAPRSFNSQRPGPDSFGVNDDFDMPRLRGPSISNVDRLNPQGNVALPDSRQVEALNRESLRSAEATRRSNNIQNSIDRQNSERWTREGQRALTHGTTADSQAYGQTLLERAGRVPTPQPTQGGPMSVQQTAGYKNLTTGENPLDDATAMSRVGASTQPTSQPTAPAFDVDANKRRVADENADIAKRADRGNGAKHEMDVTIQQMAAMRAAAPNDAAFADTLGKYGYDRGTANNFSQNDPTGGTGVVERPDLAPPAPNTTGVPRSLVGPDTGGPPLSQAPLPAGAFPGYGSAPSPAPRTFGPMEGYNAVPRPQQAPQAAAPVVQPAQQQAQQQQVIPPTARPQAAGSFTQSRPAVQQGVQPQRGIDPLAVFQASRGGRGPSAKPPITGGSEIEAKVAKIRPDLLPLGNGTWTDGMQIWAFDPALNGLKPVGRVQR
jgi:hypothetical protein